MAQQTAPIGPNDFHVDDQGKLHAGLGKDQPKPEQTEEARLNTEARLAGMRAEIAAATKDLSEREQQAAGLRAEIAAREAAADAREKALAAREAALAAASSKK